MRLSTLTSRLDWWDAQQNQSVVKLKMLSEYYFTKSTSLKSGPREEDENCIVTIVHIEPQLVGVCRTPMWSTGLFSESKICAEWIAMTWHDVTSCRCDVVTSHTRRWVFAESRASLTLHVWLGCLNSDAQCCNLLHMMCRCIDSVISQLEFNTYLLYLNLDLNPWILKNVDTFVLWE